MAGQQPATALGSNFVSHNHAFSQSNPFVTATSALPIAHSAQTLDQSQVKVTMPQAFYFMKSSGYNGRAWRGQIFGAFLDNLKFLDRKEVLEQVPKCFSLANDIKICNIMTPKKQREMDYELPLFY